MGAKGIYDTNVDAGDSITPELSGIFSYADDDKTWGVSLNASYQKRESSAAGSTVNDWHIQPWHTNLEENRSSAPLFVDNRGTVYGPTASADDVVPDALRLNMILVRPEQRRQGLASAMLATLLARHPDAAVRLVAPDAAE